jgi:hypothetical protein
MATSDLFQFSALAARDNGLVVVTSLRADSTIQASVVNAGVLENPRTAAPSVALVAMGGSRKLANFRARPRTTIVARAGWEWIAVEGDADIIGPDDPVPAAGGTHDDWPEYDRVMAEGRRAAVFVAAERVYSNG